MNSLFKDRDRSFFQELLSSGLEFRPKEEKFQVVTGKVFFDWRGT
jgi:hypothetical protein